MGGFTPLGAESVPENIIYMIAIGRYYVRCWAGNWPIDEVVYGLGTGVYGTPWRFPDKTSARGSTELDHRSTYSQCVISEQIQNGNSVLADSRACTKVTTNTRSE